MILGRDADTLGRGLDALAAGEPAAGLVRAGAVADAGRLAVMFTGQGSQYPGMGRELYEAYPQSARST